MQASGRLARCLYTQSLQQKRLLFKVKLSESKSLSLYRPISHSARSYGLIRSDVKEKDGDERLPTTQQPGEVGEFRPVGKKPTLKEPIAKAMYLGRFDPVSFCY